MIVDRSESLVVVYQQKKKREEKNNACTQHHLLILFCAISSSSFLFFFTNKSVAYQFDSEKLQIKTYAMREIEKGEELTISCKSNQDLFAQLRDSQI